MDNFVPRVGNDTTGIGVNPFEKMVMTFGVMDEHSCLLSKMTCTNSNTFFLDVSTLV